MQSDDTIVAVSSAIGAGAARIIIRLNGSDAHKIVRDVLNFDDPSDNPSASLRRLRFRNLDSVPAWIYQFANPSSVTGENVLELHLPGNTLLAKLILDDLIRAGARQAEPGEFTARAFFNGKLDLTEAEGVAAIVSAHSQAELDAGRRLLSGELARRLAPMMESIAGALALTEAGIDFADEGISFLPDEKLAVQIDLVLADLQKLLNESARFDRLTHEPQVVLAGRPNAGKSTLLNALAGFERAIVSPEPGTTRDALRATIRLPRGLVQLIDAAGLDHPGDDEISRQMHATSLRAIESADVVALVRDCTDDRPAIVLPRSPGLTIISKCDLAQSKNNEQGIQISAKTGAGLDQLRSKLDELCFGGATDRGSTTLALAGRHVRAIDDAIASLTRARNSINAGAEIIALELREALDFLGSILGEVTPDDVLGRVFSAFCIGK